MNHVGLAPKVGLYPPLRRRRVRDIGVHSLRSDPVPLPPAVKQRPERGPADRIATPGEGAVAVVPVVAEGVGTVRDIGRLLAIDDGLGPRARAGVPLLQVSK